MSLKLSVGLTPKAIADGPMHASPDMRRMIAELNTGYRPSLIVLDGVAAFTDGGPSRGELKAGNVMIAGHDRVAVDAVGLAMLKSLGANQAIMGRRIFEQEQIARAVELGLGVPGPGAIEIVTADADSGAVAGDAAADPGSGLSAARLGRGTRDGRGRFVANQVFELRPEVLQRHAAGRGQLGQLVRIVEVVALQPDHVAARDGVARPSGCSPGARARVRSPDRAAGRTESARTGPPASRSWPRCRPQQDVLGRAVAEVARVLHVEAESDRRTAARSRCSWSTIVVLMSNSLSRLHDLRLQDLADVDLGDPQVAVGVTLDVLERASGPSGSRSSTRPSAITATPSPAAVAQALDDGARRGCRRPS